MRQEFMVLGLLKFGSVSSPRFKQEEVTCERPQSTKQVRPVASAGMNFSSMRVKKSCWEGCLT